ncbi:MAG: polyphosphate kinase 2 [Phycisphaerales bacterium]
MGESKDPDRSRRGLIELQIELGKMQQHVIESDQRVLIILEGRDAAGKDGTIKRITEHMRPRKTRVVALSKPSDREQTQWYFQRWVAHLPSAGEIVIFNRSWYNRAGVERVMGFCDQVQYDRFMDTVGEFEAMLVRSGIHLRKYFLDITKDEQAERFDDRRSEPLKQWKISPIDQVAQEKWKEYSAARDAMLARTHTVTSPWSIVRNDVKRRGRRNLIRDLLLDFDYPERDESKLRVDPEICFRYTEEAHRAGLIAP